MDIQEAKNEELQEIMSFYNMMCEELGKKDFLPEGDKGGFPSKTGSYILERKTALLWLRTL